MQKDTDHNDKYAKVEKESKRHIDAIIGSSSKKKIVVAGPGTGKTYLFKEILDGKKNTLTLTFIRSLVEELSLELYGLSEVKTLHSFAHSKLSGATRGNIKVYQKLEKIIKEDAKILLGNEVDFDRLFHNRDDDNELIEFYKKRKKYYDEHYGYTDIIFALVKYLEGKKEKIPAYDLVLVDEFQDFNQLEISLIDLLSEKSPILLVGDDDQALYERLKSASAKHIRERFGDTRPDYESFSLPYCRRCTRVIVEVANDIINASSENGFLKDRIKKEYKYFHHKGKDLESDNNPKIMYSQQFARKIPWFIEQQLAKVAEDVKEKFSVLIISPTTIKSRSIVDALTGKGFVNIESVKKRDAIEPTLLDGLKILLDDKDSNLGWRIVSGFLLKTEDFELILKESDKGDAKRFFEMIKKKEKKEVKEMLRVLRMIKKDKEIDIDDLDGVLRKVDFDPHDIAKDLLKDEIISGSKGIGHPALRKIPIKVTTIEGSKGLSEDYVFITYFDDRYFIKDKNKENIADKDICNFLVTLTRARRKVFLISSNTKEEPTFLKWIKSDRIEKVS